MVNGLYMELEDAKDTLKKLIGTIEAWRPSDMIELMSIASKIEQELNVLQFEGRRKIRIPPQDKYVANMQRIEGLIKGLKEKFHDSLKGDWKEDAAKMATEHKKKKEEELEDFKKSMAEYLRDVLKKLEELFMEMYETSKERMDAFFEFLREQLAEIEKAIRGIDEEINGLDQQVDGLEEQLRIENEEIAQYDVEVQFVAQQREGLEAQIRDMDVQTFVRAFRAAGLPEPSAPQLEELSVAAQQYMDEHPPPSSYGESVEGITAPPPSYEESVAAAEAGVEAAVSGAEAATEAVGDKPPPSYEESVAGAVAEAEVGTAETKAAATEAAAAVEKDYAKRMLQEVILKIPNLTPEQSEALNQAMGSGKLEECLNKQLKQTQGARKKLIIEVSGLGKKLKAKEAELEEARKNKGERVGELEESIKKLKQQKKEKEKARDQLKGKAAEMQQQLREVRKTEDPSLSNAGPG